MLKLKVIGSSSSGNSYALVDSSGKILLLDLGMSVKEIKRGIDYRISDVVGAVVTHSHLDHSKSVKDFEDMGIPVFKPYVKALKKCEKRTFGEFEITSFPLLDKNMEKWQHTNSKTDEELGEECPCYGFYINHADMGKMVYITDTKCVSWDFSKIKLNHILISSNYDERCLSDNEKREHVLKGHLSIQYVCEKFIEPNKSNALRNVILCHLSKENIEPIEAQAEVEKVANCPVYVAEKGIEIELSEFPF